MDADAPFGCKPGGRSALSPRAWDDLLEHLDKCFLDLSTVFYSIGSGTEAEARSGLLMGVTSDVEISKV